MRTVIRNPQLMLLAAILYSRMFHPAPFGALLANNFSFLAPQNHLLRIICSRNHHIMTVDHLTSSTSLHASAAISRFRFALVAQITLFALLLHGFSRLPADQRLAAAFYGARSSQHDLLPPRQSPSTLGPFNHTSARDSSHANAPRQSSNRCHSDSQPSHD